MHPLALAFSPDGTRILFGDGTVIRSEPIAPPPPNGHPHRDRHPDRHDQHPDQN